MSKKQQKIDFTKHTPYLDAGIYICTKYHALKLSFKNLKKILSYSFFIEACFSFKVVFKHRNLSENHSSGDEVIFGGAGNQYIILLPDKTVLRYYTTNEKFNSVKKYYPQLKELMNINPHKFFDNISIEPLVELPNLHSLNNTQKVLIFEKILNTYSEKIEHMGYYLKDEMAITTMINSFPQSYPEKLIAEIYESEKNLHVFLNNFKWVPSHCDLTQGNIFSNGIDYYVIDLEHATFMPAFYDLINLAFAFAMNQNFIVIEKFLAGIYDDFFLKILKPKYHNEFIKHRRELILLFLHLKTTYTWEAEHKKNKDETHLGRAKIWKRIKSL